MNKDPIVFVGHISEAISSIESFSKKLNKEHFLKNKEKQYAVIRAVEIMGEAVKNIPDSFRIKYPNVEWKKIVGARDKLIHDYFGVDLEAVWDIIEHDLPNLKREINKILENNKQEKKLILMEFKKSFTDRYEKLTDINEFKEYCSKDLRKSIRVNTLKISVKEFLERTELDLEKIKWCNEGFFVKNKVTLGNLNDHFLGYFYVQESASMLPPLVLDIKDKILDMCSAPGSKTGQIAAMMKNKGLIIANDFDYIRLKALDMNLQRLGVINTVITNMKGYFIKEKFDSILLDAPCSGTGTIRKSPGTLEIYNTKMIKKLSAYQKGLINNAFNILNEKGSLVYSTCSLEPEENEEVVDFLFNKYENARVEKIKFNNLKTSDAVLEFEGKRYGDEVKKCIRIWPQDNDTSGFFVAKIRKV